MNILLLTQFLSKTKGGGEYVFSIIANLLAAKGHNVWIITHEIEGEDYLKFHKNVRIIFVSKIRYEGGLPPSFEDNIKFILQSIFKGLQIIKKEKIDLIHSNNFSPALSGSILSALTSKPHIITVHDIFSLCGKQYWKMWGKQSNVSRSNVLLAPFFEKMIIKLKHNAIHAVSEATRDDLVKFGATKPINIVYSSIDTTESKEIKPDPLQFVYVGRLVFYKNLETVIRAISIVKKSYSKIKLKIIGGGPSKESLMTLTSGLGLENNIEFCGYVSEETKMEIISSSISMVFPSLCEGFGLVILEAFSLNRPVIVSNVKPLSEIIDNNVDGLVIDSKDEKKWAEAMIQLISHPEIALRMGVNGNKKLQGKYTQKNMISGIETMYEKVVYT